MALTDIEKSMLHQLIEKEVYRQRPANMFWLIDCLTDDTIQSEAHRLVQEERILKEAEIASWPATAQEKYATLQSELADLQALESKLIP